MFKVIWSPVKKLLVKIGRVQTVIIMAVVYFVIIGPMAILYQIFRRNPTPEKSYWIKRQPIIDYKEFLRRQF